MQSKNLQRSQPTLFLALALSALGGSCATPHIPLNISTDHPASPAAAEAPFTPPPNPFAETEPASIAVVEPTAMDPQDHGDPSGHTMPTEEVPPEIGKQEEDGHTGHAMPMPDPPLEPGKAESPEGSGPGHHATEPPPGGVS